MIAHIPIGIVILFVPGFLLSFLLFPERKSLDFWERIAISIGLSALIDMLIITILAQPSISALRFLPVVGSIFTFCVACGLVLFFWKKSLKTFLKFFKSGKNKD